MIAIKQLLPSIALVAVLNTNAAEPGTLTWADLVNHPERWPAETKVGVQLKFKSGVLPAGTAVHIENVTPAGAQLIAPQGFIFNIDQKNCDLLAVANTMWTRFTPEQRAITAAKLATDNTLWPGKVKLIEAGEFGPIKMPAGTEWPVMHVKPNEVGLA